MQFAAQLTPASNAEPDSTAASSTANPPLALRLAPSLSTPQAAPAAGDAIAAEPAPVFMTDASGEIITIGSTDGNDRPLDPSRLCGQLAPSDEVTIAYTRRRVEEMVCTASMWFDGLFGDRYYVSESRKINGTLELSESYSQYYGNDIRLRFDARVPLPNLNRHLSAFIGRDNEDDFIQDRFDNTTLRNNFPRVDEHEKMFAGLGYSLPSSKRFSTDLRIGVRGLAPPQAFVQARARYNAYADDNDLVSFRMTPFFTTTDRFGVTAGADYSRVLSQKLLFRFGNVGTWSQTTQGLNWRSTLSLYQALPSIRSGLAYELFARGATKAEVPLREYGVQTTFRHPIVGGKLFGEWTLGYSFPREELDEHREGAYRVGAAVQMPFGKP